MTADVYGCRQMGSISANPDFQVTNRTSSRRSNCHYKLLKDAYLRHLQFKSNLKDVTSVGNPSLIGTRAVSQVWFTSAGTCKSFVSGTQYKLQKERRSEKLQSNS